MNKQDVVNSLHKKIKRIDLKYKVVDANGHLSLQGDFSDWEICRFVGFDKENFRIDCTAFIKTVSDIIKEGEITDSRLLVAQTFYKEGYRLLGGLDND